MTHSHTSVRFCFTSFSLHFVWWVDAQPAGTRDSRSWTSKRKWALWWMPGRYQVRAAPFPDTHRRSTRRHPTRHHSTRRHQTRRRLTCCRSTCRDDLPPDVPPHRLLSLAPPTTATATPLTTVSPLAPATAPSVAATLPFATALAATIVAAVVVAAARSPPCTASHPRPPPPTPCLPTPIGRAVARRLRCDATVPPA